MRHCKVDRKFNMTCSHRKLMFRNLLISLIKHELIRTTLPKAKELKNCIEPLITLSKKEAYLRKNMDIKDVMFKSQIVSLRRRAFNILRNKDSVNKLFEKLSYRYLNISGGYTRIVKCGYRYGDKASLAYIQLIIINQEKKIL